MFEMRDSNDRTKQLSNDRRSTQTLTGRVIKRHVKARVLLLQEVMMFAGLGHYEIEIKVDSSAAHILPSTRCWTHEAHRFENLVASRLDCCERCEIEEDTEKTELGRHVDAHTKCEGPGGLFTVDGTQVLQRTRQGVDGHETVQTGSDCECESVLAWLRGRVKINWVFQPCTSRLYLVWFSCVVR